MEIQLDVLLGYTEWERGKWREFFHKHGDDVLGISVGPHRDGRFETVGDWVSHIFSAEMRYIDRLRNRPLTDPASIPNANVDAIFEFGMRSRAELRKFLDVEPVGGWDTPRNFQILTFSITATPKKIVTHVVMHEIRHWAQIATMLRLNGYVEEFHDLLGSPVLGGAWKRANA